MAGKKIHHWKHGWIPLTPWAKAYKAGKVKTPPNSSSQFAPPAELHAYGAKKERRRMESQLGANYDSLMASLKEGGFTYDPEHRIGPHERTGRTLQVGVDKGIAVARPGTEHVVGKEVVEGEYMTRADFIKGMSDVIEKYSDEIGMGAKIGGWYSPERNEFMVELTDVFPPDQKDEAVFAGKRRNQEAIFDIGTGEIINTGGTGDRTALKIEPGLDTPISTVFTEPLTVEQTAAIKYYTGPGYKPFNNALRNGTEMSPAAKFYSKQLDTAIQQSVLTEDATAFRGITTWPGFPKEFKPGDTMTDPGYTSTATDPSGKYPGDVKMVIRVPKGAKALDVYGNGISHHMNERELLLPRGTTLRAISDTPGNPRLVEMEVVVE